MREPASQEPEPWPLGEGLCYLRVPRLPLAPSQEPEPRLEPALGRTRASDRKKTGPAVGQGGAQLVLSPAPSSPLPGWAPCYLAPPLEPQLVCLSCSLLVQMTGYSWWCPCPVSGVPSSSPGLSWALCTPASVQRGHLATWGGSLLPACAPPAPGRPTNSPVTERGPLRSHVHPERPTPTPGRSQLTGGGQC